MLLIMQRNCVSYHLQTDFSVPLPDSYKNALLCVAENLKG
jgi:hypothetical protein